MQPCNVGFYENNIPKAESLLSVWPDPSRGIVNIAANAGEGVEVSIMSTQGQLIGTYPWNKNIDKSVLQVKEIYGFTSGRFIVFLKKDGIIIATRKLIVNQ